MEFFYPGGKLSLGELLEVAIASRGMDIKTLSEETGVPEEQIKRLLLNLDPGVPNHLLRIMEALSLCIIEKPDGRSEA